MNASETKQKISKHSEIQNPNSRIENHKYKAIVIGVSAGGFKALKTILSNLPSDFALSVIIVLHRHSDSDNHLERSLNDICKIRVKQANEKEGVKDGVVYVAPPNYHLLIEDDKTFSLSVEGAVNYARPSIDVLFESAAYAYGSELIGIVLTGSNKDGSQGLKRIKETGGLTIVQSPETADFSDMPRAAIAAVELDHILPLNQIGPFLRKLKIRKNE